MEAIAFYGGKCPCCSVRDIVGSAGEKLDGAEWDHFFANHRAKVDETWLVCKQCNQSFRHTKNRHEAEHDFRQYQKRRMKFEERGFLPLVDGADE